MTLKSFMLTMALTAMSAMPLRAEVVALPNLQINLKETSVSGLSSGGFMAVQFHVANSAFVKGAGVIAGGPFFCAKDNQDTATSICSCTGFAACHTDQASSLVPDLIQRTDQFAQQNAIDATSHLSTSRVWLFSGSLDSVVPPPVMGALETYYKHYVPAANVTFKKDIASEHAMPTDAFGNACNVRGDPFINNCQFDAAGELLRWIYGPLNAKSTGAPSGKFIQFDQAPFLDHATEHGLSKAGWVYVPNACEHNPQCKVHVVFHGCKQYPEAPYSAGPQGQFGDTYVKKAGYNAWADTNHLVILYPQAKPQFINTRPGRSNPNGCWDWWGYDDGDYAKKTGHQMAAVKKMVEQLAGLSVPTQPQPNPTLFCGTATNVDHAAAGRAQSWFFWWYFAQGSGDSLGLGGSQTTLKETATGSFTKVAACP
jgi:hypothetical protein